MPEPCENSEMNGSNECTKGRLIKEIRTDFMRDYQSNEDCYDDADLSRVLNDEWLIDRYLEHCNNDVQKASTMLKESMKWRQSFGVNKFKVTDFPSEFYRSGSFFSYAKDKNNNIVIYLRGKLHRKIPEWCLLFKQYFVFVINEVERQSNGRKYTFLWDCQDAGIPNVDLDIMKFMFKVMTCYFPSGIDNLLLYEMPWILYAVYNLAKHWVPESYQKIVRFGKINEAIESIGIDNLPDYMGGNCSMNYREVPEGVMSADEVADRDGLGQEAATKLIDHVKMYCSPENNQQNV